MRYVKVRFLGGEKTYIYKTNLSLNINQCYDIVADNSTAYTTPVRMIEYIDNIDVKYCCSINRIREITKANTVVIKTDGTIDRNTKSRPKSGINKVIFNEIKKTTVVIWEDGVKTIVHCGPEDVFDREKGLALCYMKRYHENRGCFNETLKEYCYD